MEPTLRNFIIVMTIGLTGTVLATWWLIDYEAKNAEVRRVAWMDNCVKSGFPEKQCEVLWSVKRSGEQAEEAAAVGIGLAVGAQIGASAAGARR